MQRLQKMYVKNLLLGCGKNVNLRGMVIIETNVLPSGTKSLTCKSFERTRNVCQHNLQPFDNP